MSGKNIFFVLSLVFGICILAGCSKENPVEEKKFTNLELYALTVDPYRFRVSVSDEVVTDSLLTPEGKVAKTIFFNEYRQRIRVYNTSDETLLIDTPYTFSIGKINVFTIYQTQVDIPPFYLAPSPTEPKAAPGKTKFSIMPSGASLSDSVRVIVEEQTSGTQTKPRDTAVVQKDNFSRYFEVTADLDTKVYFYKLPGGNQLLGQITYSSTTDISLNTDFTIVRLSYIGSTALESQKLY